MKVHNFIWVFSWPVLITHRCGKTTQVPQFIIDASLRSSSQGGVANVICTQPRRISAMSVAERVAKERSSHLGGIVGYQIRLESKQVSGEKMFGIIKYLIFCIDLWCCGWLS